MYQQSASANTYPDYMNAFQPTLLLKQQDTESGVLEVTTVPPCKGCFPGAYVGLTQEYNKSTTIRPGPIRPIEPILN